MDDPKAPASSPDPSQPGEEAPPRRDLPFELEEALVSRAHAPDPPLAPPPPLRALDPNRIPRQTPEPWTAREGTLDTLRFIGRRALSAAAVWLLLAAILAFMCDLGHVAGALSFFALMIAVFSLACGLPVGLVFSRGLIDAVRFTGWIPWALALGASVVVIGVGTLLVHLVEPFPSSFFATLVGTMACIGAGAAVSKATWAES